MQNVSYWVTVMLLAMPNVAFAAEAVQADDGPDMTTSMLFMAVLGLGYVGLILQRNRKAQEDAAKNAG